MQDMIEDRPLPSTSAPSGAMADAPQRMGSAETGAVNGQTTDAAGDVAAKASSFVGQLKDRANTAAGAQKGAIADQIDSLAGAVHNSSEQFKGQQDWIASAVERGASELSGLATSLRENDLGTLLRQVQAFARQQPALFIGAAFAAGFSLARFGKIVASDVSADDLPTMPEIVHGQH